MSTRPDTLSTPVPDSASVSRPDSAGGAAPDSAAAGPSYFSTAAPAATAAPEAFRPGTPQAVFGPDTRLQAVVSAGAPGRRGEAPELNGLLLDGAAVGLFVLYFYLIFRHRGSIALLFRALTVKGQFDQLIDEQSVAFRRFVAGARVTGFLALLTALLKACLLWGDSAPPIPEAWTPWLLPALAGALLAIGCYRRIVTATIAGLGGDSARVDSLRRFDRLWFVASALFFTPVVLLTATAAPTARKTLLMIGVIVLIIFILYYIIKSFSFFLSRKVSVLQWILYLCAVEIFPVSVFVLWIRRGFVW